MPPSATAGQILLEKLNRKLTHFKVTATSAENTDTLPKSVGVRAKEGQISLNARSVEKDIMDNHHTKIHKKEDGKVVEKEMAKEHRRVATKSQDLQRNSGQADPGNSGQINLGKLTSKVRAGEKQMTGAQQSRVLKHKQQMKNFNMLPSANCDFRILVFASHIESFQPTLPSEPSHLALIPLHAKLLFLPINPRRAGI